jgi:hypothetical protein
MRIYGEAKARVDCEFCTRRWTVRSRFQNGETFMACKSCYLTLKTSDTDNLWPRDGKKRCNGGANDA